MNNEEIKEKYGLTVQQVNALNEARADERAKLSAKLIPEHFVYDMDVNIRVLKVIKVTELETKAKLLLEQQIESEDKK